MITEKQVGLLHHTLGLSPEQREPYRNYFVACTGHYDYKDLQTLESAGLMKVVKSPGFLRDEDITFTCTNEGKRFAIDNLPPPPKRTRYDEYLRNDACESFTDWLGITTPEYEHGQRWENRGLVRMVRRRRIDYRVEEVAGQYRLTKKEAKASYKEALRASKITRAAAEIGRAMP